MPPEQEPVTLADALSSLMQGGLLLSSSLSSPLSSPSSELKIIDDDDNSSDFPPPTRTDGPGAVLDRLDALDLSHRTWGEEAIRGTVIRIAELAELPSDEIVVYRSPADFPDLPARAADGDTWAERYDLALSSGWGRQLGVLTEVAWENRLRADLQVRGVAQEPVSRRRARTLWALRHAELAAGDALDTDAVHRYSVRGLVARYVGLTCSLGGRVTEPYWAPSGSRLAEFQLELELGALFVDSFCAGLGYLAAVDGQLAVARRPTVRMLDTTATVTDSPRFHHDSGPAIEFDDGTGVHALEGVPFAPWLRQALVDGALTMRYVRQFHSTEQRMAAYAVMPPRAFLDGLEVELVNVGRKGTHLYRVDDLPDHEGPVWYMTMTDPSTGREYGEFVPPEVGELESADGAQAAAWGISLTDYRRMTLEG